MPRRRKSIVNNGDLIANETLNVTHVSNFVNRRSSRLATKHYSFVNMDSTAKKHKRFTYKRREFLKRINKLLIDFFYLI